MPIEMQRTMGMPMSESPLPEEDLADPPDPTPW